MDPNYKMSSQSVGYCEETTTCYLTFIQKNAVSQTMCIGVGMILWLLKALKGTTCPCQQNSSRFSKMMTMMMISLKKTPQTLNWTVILIIS